MRALIFDYDGLIVDSERVLADCIVEILAEWGVIVTFEDFGHLFGTVDADAIWDELLAAWCGRTLAELDARIEPLVAPRKDVLPLLPGVRKLLDAARAAGWKIGLGTGNRSDILRRRLARNGIDGYFDTIVTRVEVPLGKPAPDIFLEVARRLDVEPHDCLVLEDSVPGCEAAIAAGMRVIACPSAVSVHCAFPAAARRVSSLLEVDLHA